MKLQDNQEMLARRVGSSKRTVQRWETGRTDPAPWHVHKLIDAIRPLDPDLASQLEARAPRPAPPPPPVAVAAPPAPSTASNAVLAAAVVCAAAEAMNVPPQAIRPALLAAFKVACDVRLAPEAVVHELTPPELPKEATKTRKSPS